MMDREIPGEGPVESGRVSYSALDLESGEARAEGAEERHRAASSIKPIIWLTLAEVVRNDADISWEDRVCIAGDLAAVAGSGVLHRLCHPIEVSLWNLGVLMNIVSDNVATNALIARVGFDRINATCVRLGLVDTQVRRLMTGFVTGEPTPDNWTSSRDLLSLYVKIWEGEAGHPEDMAALVEILRGQQFSNRIGKHLKSAHDVISATKGGSTPNVVLDAGLVWRQGRRPVGMAIAVSDAKDYARAEDAVASTATWILEHYGFFDGGA